MVKTFILLFSLFLFTGCNVLSQPQVKKMLQTNGATIMYQNYTHSIENIILYHSKLNARNPNNYNKQNLTKIHNEISTASNLFFLTNAQNKTIKAYQDYLNIAFDKNEVAYRNDYLIMGIYRLLFETFDMQKNHKFTSLSYNTKKFQNAYKLMKIIQWKIKNDKDIHNNYLFNTWQNNWQIELQKRIQNGETPSWELIEDLKYIKEKKETIFDASNHSFEVLTNQIIFDLEQNIRILGEEPIDVAIEAISFFIFL